MLLGATAMMKSQQTVWYAFSNDASVVVKFWAVLVRIRPHFWIEASLPILRISPRSKRTMYSCSFPSVLLLVPYGGPNVLSVEWSRRFSGWNSCSLRVVFFWFLLRIYMHQSSQVNSPFFFYVQSLSFGFGSFAGLLSIHAKGGTS